MYKFYTHINMGVFEFCNDQPGRVIAVLIIAPILFMKGYDYNDKFIMMFSIILFIWDFYWLAFTKPNVYIHNEVDSTSSL